MDPGLVELAASVDQAVHIFYFGTDAHLKENAHQLLNEIRVSPKAGQLAWVFLSDLSKPSVAHFFAATALRNCINRDWGIMSPEQHLGMRAELFKTLVAYSMAERFLHVQLCVTTADVLLRHVAYSQEEAAGILDSIKLLEMTPGWPSPDCYRHAVLSLLTVLPEQFSSIEISGTHRNLLRCKLQQAIPAVLELLSGLLAELSSSSAAATPGGITTPPILRCFTSWARFGIPINVMEPLLPTFFQATANDALFEDSVELLCEIIQNGDCYRFPTSVRKFMELTVGIFGQFQAATSQGMTEYCERLSRVVAAVGENHCKLLVDWNDSRDGAISMQFLNFALNCSTLKGNYPIDEQCTEGMLYFWFRFFEEVEHLPTSDLKQSLWTTVASPLLQALVSKVQFPVGDAWTEMNTSHKETFYTFRGDAADTVMYLSRVFFNDCMVTFHGMLSEALSQPSPPWQPVEAVFYVLRTCSDTASHCDSNLSHKHPGVLEQIFRQFLVHLPSDPRLQHTLFSFFCSFSEWLRQHEDLVPPVLSLLVAGLQKGKSPRLLQMAVDSIWEICNECRDHIVPYLDQLVTVCQSEAVRQIPKCQIRLYEAVCVIISLLPPDHCAYYTQQFLAPHLQRLSELCSQPVSDAVRNEIVQELAVLRAVVHRLDPQCDDYSDLSQGAKQAFLDNHPIRMVVSQDSLWHTFNAIVATWSRSPEVVQALCDMLEKLSFTLQEGLLFRVSSIQSLLSQIDDASVIKFPIAVTTRLLWFFPSDSVPESFQHFITNFSPLLQLLATSPSSSPDLTMAYLKLLARVLKVASGMILAPTSMIDGIAVLTFLQAAMAVPEVDVVEDACTTLVMYIREIEKHQLSESLWQHTSGNLLGNLLVALLRSSSVRQCNALSNVLFALYRHFPLQLKSALEVVFENVTPFQQVPAEEKQKFFRLLPRERSSKRAAREGVAAFVQTVAAVQRSIAVLGER